MYEERVGAKVPKAKSPEQALASLMRQCARAEKCSFDALRSMRRWGLSDEDARGVLARLHRERFIDDGRYAAAFVREKARLSGWGARKIAAALRAKSISSEAIEEALSQLSPAESGEKLEQILSKKAAKTKAASAYELKVKLIRFGISRGFDLEDVVRTAERLCRQSD